MKIGSHVSMSGKEMLLGSVKEALSYGANTFMVYTGAPQNTKRKAVEELNIENATVFMQENGIESFIVHAPYIINLANSVNPDIYKLGIDFLAEEINRTTKMGSNVIVLHPGSHVGAGLDIGIRYIANALNEILSKDTPCYIALETMAGKGSEIGRNFEEIASIFDKVTHNEKLRVCFDTCHVHDSGYDIVNSFDSVIENFDKLLGIENIAVFHINDSKNPCGAMKDRHANIGEGYIGYDCLHKIVHDERFLLVPKILETPYIPDVSNPKLSYPPYKKEIEWLLR
ncbi:MAG: deoxyribonuclease IV [Lachnospiraceae bacterium]|nr:deoxyribonuclease IV [Lachnospiraceae bacterium]